MTAMEGSCIRKPKIIKIRSIRYLIIGLFFQSLRKINTAKIINIDDKVTENVENQNIFSAKNGLRIKNNVAINASNFFFNILNVRKYTNKEAGECNNNKTT